MDSRVKKIHRLGRYRPQDIAWGYLMILPLLAGLTVFYFVPFFQNIKNSLFEVKAFNRMAYAGLRNYREMLSDTLLWKAYGNTFLYVLLIVPLATVGALVIASLLNLPIKGKSGFRMIYFLPTITMATAVAMVWRWLFNGSFGLINAVLQSLGAESIPWLTDTRYAIPAITVVSIWSTLGYNMVILLAGLQGISVSYYEAARIDGASTWDQFRYITTPLISPTLFFVVVNQFIGTFQTFDLIKMMIADNSIILEDTQSIVMYFYRNAFVLTRRGYASAIAVLIFVTIMIITGIQFALQKKWVFYD